MTNSKPGPSPEEYARSGTEDSLQISIFMWAQKNFEKYPELHWLFAIPNGGFRTKAGAGKLRAMGVKKGIPDIMLPIRRGPYAGLLIELKKEATAGKRAGQVQPDQKKWIEFFKSQGYGAMVCVGFEQTINTIIQYLEYR